MALTVIPVGLIDTGAILALLDRDDDWHEPCLEAYNNHRLPWLTTEAVLTEVLHLVLRNLGDHRGVWRLFSSGAIQMAPIANQELAQIEGPCAITPTDRWILLTPRSSTWQPASASAQF